MVFLNENAETNVTQQISVGTHLDQSVGIWRSLTSAVGPDSMIRLYILGKMV